MSQRLKPLGRPISLPFPIPILPILGGLILVGLVLMSMRVGSVQGSEIGVLVNNLTGSIEVRPRPGSFLYNGLLTDFYVLDNAVQTIRMAGDTKEGDDVNIKTQDGSDVNLDVELNYRLTQDAELIRTTVVPECGLEKIAAGRGGPRRLEALDAYKLLWIRDYARSVIRYTFGELKTDEFYQAAERDNKARQSEEELNRVLNPHGIVVLNVVPDRFRFYEEYEKKIAEKKAADQEVQSQMELARAALESQKRREVEAKALVDVEIAKVEGELKQEILAAQAEASRETLAAEAYSYTTKTAADATFYKTQNDAKAVLAAATAEAEGLRKLAASLAGEGGVNLIKKEYSKALAGVSFTGVPYATDPRIQKVEIAPGVIPPAPAGDGKGGGR